MPRRSLPPRLADNLISFIWRPASPPEGRPHRIGHVANDPADGQTRRQAT